MAIFWLPIFSRLLVTVASCSNALSPDMLLAALLRLERSRSTKAEKVCETVLGLD